MENRVSITAKLQKLQKKRFTNHCDYVPIRARATD